MRSAVETVSLAQLRRYVVAHQRYATRLRRGRSVEVAATIRRLGCVQLDSISTVDRAHRLTLTSRVGAYPRGAISRLLTTGRVFEYWAHEACLVPIEDYPLFKRRMEHLRDRHWWGRRHQHDPKVKARVLAALREQGPLPTRFFEGGGGGGMWNWKPEKRILEDLFAAGEVVVAGRDGFQRLYGLPEQVIPPEYLQAPAPSEEEFLRGYALRAVRGRGALTESAIAEHCRFRGGAKAMRPVVDSLVAEGLVRRVAVADGGAPVVVPANAELDGRATGGVLVCPFDNLLWDRTFLERVFGFRHVIEVYKRPHERVFGYYVLPFLYGDRLVGRADLKADRSEGVLRVRAFHLEPGVRASGALETALEKALARLAKAVGLDRVER
ncbi:MAG TPA: crosslink repair DNA glycosylase YcaQ family protein [Gaiellaceae bacterium]|nr:crosslink repair DNA glycosylase YcaQ family protein [Gaiellaceae bacterium]